MVNLVENAFALTTHLLKGDLLKIREREPLDGYLNVTMYGKQGAIDIGAEYDEDKAYLVINFDIEKPQRILLSEERLTYGTKTYLTCKCGCRVMALYLKNDIFACRKCCGLKYASSAINRTSKHGSFIYKVSQTNKIMDLRESMDRIFYRSKYTKSFQYWLKQCKKAGFNDEVDRANDLMSNISKHKQ